MSDLLRNRGLWLLLLLPIAVTTLFAWDTLLTVADVKAAEEQIRALSVRERPAKPILQIQDALISEPVERGSVEGYLTGKPVGVVGSDPAVEEDALDLPDAATVTPTQTGVAPQLTPLPPHGGAAEERQGRNSSRGSGGGEDDDEGRDEADDD